MLIIDIETAPLPGRELDGCKTEPYEWQDFDRSTVKLGNLKDPAKIEDKLSKAEIDHARVELTRRGEIEEAREIHAEKATLDPTRSYVQAIGWESTETGFGDQMIIKHPKEEYGMLAKFLKMVTSDASGNHHDDSHLGAWNGHNFDFPFIHVRCLANMIKTGWKGQVWRNYQLHDIMIDANLGWHRWSLADASNFVKGTPKIALEEVTTPTGRTRKKLPWEILAEGRTEDYQNYLRADVAAAAGIAGLIY